MNGPKIEPDDLKAVQDILRAHLPGVEVRAFGSRVHGENLKPFSDLDLAIITESPLDIGKMAELKEAFAESSLPFKVDLLDWSVASGRFRDLAGHSFCVIRKK
jgi:predicted nucleotidyltransferase